MGGIRGKTPGECFDQFAEHLNVLLQSTLSRKAHVRISVLDDGGIEKGTLGWSDEKFLPVTTQYGRLYLWLAQSLECTHEPKEAANRRYRLSTREYWYRLQRTEALDGASLIRWEYTSPQHDKYKGKRWCWRHVQLDGSTDLPGGKMNFDRLHTPSGYVVIEDVLRYLFNDLKVKPQSRDWHDLLIESEKKFKRDFNQP